MAIPSMMTTAFKRRKLGALSTAMTHQNRENTYHLVAGETDAGARLDRFLAAGLAGLSRSRLKSLIESGQVRCGEATITEPDYRVKPGDPFTVAVPVATPAVPEPQDLPLTVVYEDSDLIVIEKPAGLVVHPAAGHADGTLVNALLGHCGSSLSGIGGVSRPGIVHRLDKDTSGLLVAAKNDRAHQGLARLFEAHDLERCYHALVWGLPSPPAGEITGNIGRDRRNRKKMAVLRHGGKTALTHYQTLSRYRALELALIECRLATGRTHQIRVHLNQRGHPVIGDPLYGRSAGRRRALPEDLRTAVVAFPRQALHAAVLGFRHPCRDQDLRFTSPLPADMATLLDTIERADVNPAQPR